MRTRRRQPTRYSLNPGTLEVLDVLGNAEWFSNCGRRLREVKARWVKSWNDALKVTQSMNWPMGLVMISNDVVISLTARDPTIVTNWRQFKETVRPLLEPIVKAKTDRVVTEHNLPNEFVGAVHCTIENALAEIEFRELSPPFFFCELVQYYEKGHYPCGWDGDYPTGKVVLW